MKIQLAALLCDEDGNWRYFDGDMRAADWDDRIAQWLRGVDGPFTSAAALRGALGMAEVTRSDEMRVGKVLARCGCTVRQRRVNGVRARFWEALA